MKTYNSGRSRNYSKNIAYLILILICCSCARYQTQYSDEGKNWAKDKPSPSLILKHTMYLVGDAGNSIYPDTVAVLKYLKGWLATETINSSIIFLGDNIYPHGIPPENKAITRKVAEYRLNTQLDILSKFAGYPIFTPGNHDWAHDFNGIRRQGNLIQEHLDSIRGKEDKRHYFLPFNGSAGPELRRLSKDLVIIIIDSQLLITDWKKNGENFMSQFKDLIRSSMSSNIVVAMHHPPYTYGPHGGKAKIPGRQLATLILRQDMKNRHYRHYKEAILSATKDNKRCIFVSGHEHTLQYLEMEHHSFIVSGSGSKTSPVGLGKESLFASASVGYSKLSFFEGGETWVTFYEVAKDGKSAAEIFQKKIKN